ncbi:MAG: hypothetical protein ABSC03_02880 [Verrucomicrobiota bacterium]
MNAKFIRLVLVAMATTGLTALAQPQSLYENDFEKAGIGKVPDGMTVLDGAFAVREAGGNRFLELPGAPLEEFGVLFGPPCKDNIAVEARVFGTATGRRYPTFALSLNGAGGYRLKVSPGRRALELFKGDENKLAVPFAWQPGKWTHLRLEVRKANEGTWRVQGRAWSESEPEPAAWMITLNVDQEPSPGRAGLFGSPISGTPIWFDDLRVTALP